MKKNGFIIAMLATAALVSSCYSVSSREDGPNASRLLSYTELLERSSLRTIVHQFNNMTDEALFACGTGKDDASFKEMNWQVTKLADSVWQVSSPDPEMAFVTKVTMLPEVCDILGIRKHVWSLETEGTSQQNEYSSSFRTVEPMVFSWIARDYGGNIQVDESRRGSFRIETFLGTRNLDYGVLNYTEDGDRTFKSSQGDLSDSSFFYY